MIPQFASSIGSGVVPPFGLIKLGIFGDSREDPTSTPGVDMNDGLERAVREDYTSQPSPGVVYQFYMPDMELVVNGGVSGSRAEDWDSGSRTKTLAQIAAVPYDVIVIQYCTNDIQTGVSSAGTRDSVAAQCIGDLKAMIDYFLGQGKKVVWETVMQRTESSGAFAYGISTVNKRDCCDLINADLVPWVQAHGSYGTDLALSDTRTLITGATSGAYALTATGYMTDGVHPTWLGAIEIARITSAAIRTLYPVPDIQQPMTGTDGVNLINGVSVANVFKSSVSTTNCSGGTVVYGVDAEGFDYTEVTVTITGANAVFAFEIAADVGSNGGRTPPHTVTAGDILNGRCQITITDGAGSFSPKVWNVFSSIYCGYVGGVPSLQALRNGQATTGTNVLQGAFDNCTHQIWGLTLTGGSPDIGAPADFDGLRLRFAIYATTGTGTYFVRFTNPQIEKQL